VKHTFEVPIFFKMSKVQCKHMMSNLKPPLTLLKANYNKKRYQITIPTSKCDIYDWNNICLMIKPNHVIDFVIDIVIYAIFHLWFVLLFKI
jgi:hypothetical protein